MTLSKPFYIVGQPHSYTLEKTGLFKIVNDIKTNVTDNTLELLLLGKLKIDDRFLPGFDEIYYVPFYTGVESIYWQNNEEDRIYFDLGLVCPSYDEADKMLVSILALIKELKDAGKKVQRNPKDPNKRH